jgi:hypothetical protein
MELGLAERLRGYAALQDRLDDGCQKAGRGAQQLDVLVQLPGQRGIEQEPVRGLNERVIPCAESVAARLRELQRGGLGEIPGVRLIFWRPRARLFGNLIARSGY